MTRRWFFVLAAAVSLWGAGCGEDDKAAKKSAGEAGMDTSGVDRVIEQAHLALERVINGTSEEYNRLFSQRYDVSLGNRSARSSKAAEVVETVATPQPATGTVRSSRST